MTDAITADLQHKTWTAEATSQFGDRQVSFTAAEGWSVTGLIYPSFENDFIGTELIELRIRDAAPCHVMTSTVP